MSQGILIYTYLMASFRCELLVKEVSKTIQAIPTPGKATAPQLHRKILLLKTPHTGVTGHGKIKLTLN